VKNSFNFKIILAEDDPDDVLFFELALKEISGFITIRHAANGQKLMDLLNESIPDFLFLDIHMPCKGGLDCIKEIRNHRKYDGMPVIMITGSNFFKDIQNTYLFGANRYIFKTVKIEDLVSTLTHIFSMDWKQAAKPPLSEFVL
jgi:CheY-like chemotaxis protein